MIIKFVLSGHLLIANSIDKIRLPTHVVIRAYTGLTSLNNDDRSVIL